MLSSQERTDLLGRGGGGYRGTIRTLSSKVGKKSMCKKGHVVIIRAPRDQQHA